jgi:transposase-like protein
MISMYTKQEIIIRSYREGKSQRQISRELQISRKTVRKYLREHEEALQTAVSEAAGRAINLSRAPIYKKAQPRTKIKLTREVESAIDRLLEKNEQKKQQGRGDITQIELANQITQIHTTSFFFAGCDLYMSFVVDGEISVSSAVDIIQLFRIFNAPFSHSNKQYLKVIIDDELITCKIKQ